MPRAGAWNRERYFLKGYPGEGGVRVEVGVRSDMGLVRTNNEDHFGVVASMNLFVLCDGMGGQAAGEVASKLGVKLILEHCQQALSNPQLELVGEFRSEFTPQTNRLASGVRLSNQAIYEQARQRWEVNGMGSTVVAAQITGNILSLAHVGDSRAYLFRAGEFRQLTDDHSLVMEQVRQGLLSPEEAKRSELSNVILRALGAAPTVDVDLDEVWVSPGDQVLLCSDGLTRMLPDEKIAAILAASAHPQEAADRLVEGANEAGGEDNITVIVAHLLRSRSTSWWGRIFGGGSREWPS